MNPAASKGSTTRSSILIGTAFGFASIRSSEPIGFGFASSLSRCFEIRRRFPESPMMLGVGNLTELTEVDSAGINVLLAGFCQELGIHSVLTTEVIPWCRSCVRELDVARRLVAHAVRERVLAEEARSPARHAARSEALRARRC